MEDSELKGKVREMWRDKTLTWVPKVDPRCESTCWIAYNRKTDEIRGHFLDKEQAVRLAMELNENE